MKARWKKFLALSNNEPRKSGAEMAENEILERLEQVLDRSLPLDPVGSIGKLMAAGAKKANSLPEPIDLPNIAIGFDANAFLHIPKSKSFVDVSDYISSKHIAPVVLPGQVVQEFWTNQYAALHTNAASINGKLDQLESEMKKIDPRFGDFSNRVKLLISEMADEFGYLRDPSIMNNIATFCNMMLERSSRKYVPRMRFHGIAVQRKRTRTPPGFKDDGDGDFYVWAEYLYNLALCANDGGSFNRCVFVTDDKKIDWSFGGMAHPILTAEADLMLGVEFEIWSMKRFEDEVRWYLSTIS